MSAVARDTLPDDAILPARWRVALPAPATTSLCVFQLPPAIASLRVSGSGGVIVMYTAALTTSCHLGNLFSTVMLSAAVTLATLVLSTITGLLLVRRNTPSKRMITAVLISPLAFPGVMVGPMMILLVERQELLGNAMRRLIDEKWVFAHSTGGLFLGCLYSSIPRAVLTVMAAAEELDRSLKEAVRLLGVSLWQVTRDALVSGLAPVLTASETTCFATSMGAFGTAFASATDIDVLPMMIYTEFTLSVSTMMAAALSAALGVMTWLALATARTASGSSSEAAA